MRSIKRWIASYIQHRMLIKRKRENDPKYKRMEFSKRLAIFACIVTVFSIMLSALLAFLDKETISDVSVAIISGASAIVAGYMGKSAYEKSSRNKYGLDENGNPWGIAEGIEITEESEETEEEIYG